MIGSLQWVIPIERLDIATTVMSLSSFSTSVVTSYMKNAIICFHSQEPDYSDLPLPGHDWDTSVYGKISEILPTDAPTPLGKPVVTSCFVDANLFCDMLTGYSVTGVLYLVNQTPIDYFFMKQATVETATCGSEFLAACTCDEQIIDLCNTLGYLGSLSMRRVTYLGTTNLLSTVPPGCMPGSTSTTLHCLFIVSKKQLHQDL